ncbi:MAG: flagellar hook protein FlgE [Candidatus Kapaibacterium sp.]
MALIRSLTIGASSLQAHQQRFDVISNNLANSNTIGYKSSQANFVDQLSQTMKHGRNPDQVGEVGAGGTNPLQYGLGVKMGSVMMDMTQGPIETTNRPLDMAIQGDGFFIYNMRGQDFYSRAGAVTRDRDGYLIDSASGAYLQGYNVETDATGRIMRNTEGRNIINSSMQNIRIESNMISAPAQTQNIRLSGNLNSEAPTGEARTTSIDIFDNVGGVHTVSLTFTKSANPGEYAVTGEVDGNAVNLSAANITFNDDGTVSTPNYLDVTAADLNAALGQQLFDENTPKDISIELADPNNLLQGMTNFAANTSATIVEKDGFSIGEIIELQVDPEGKIWGSFTNGQSEVLGQLAIAKFSNQDSLIKEGGNFYSMSPNSGLPNIGTAGDIFPSTKIAGNALEQSNVDLTQEFTEMISTQRAFEAAARTITVSDQLISETTMLKR